MVFQIDRTLEDFGAQQWHWPKTQRISQISKAGVHSGPTAIDGGCGPHQNHDVYCGTQKKT